MASHHVVAFLLVLAAAACGDEGSGGADTASPGDVHIDTVATADTAAAGDTSAVPDADTVDGPDTSAADTGDTSAGDTADTADGDDDTSDPCAEVKCAAPACPPAQQVTPPGECCAVCDPPACAGSADCTRCIWPSAPASVADCYCTACPVALVTTAVCGANQAAWELHCADWAPDPACPVPRCINQPAPVCDAGTCVEDPEACLATSACVRCNHAVAPASPDDCQCPACGVPMAVTHCENIEAAVLTHCAGLLDDCLPPPCAPPPPLTCDLGTFRCELDFGSPDDPR